MGVKLHKLAEKPRLALALLVALAASWATAAPAVPLPYASENDSETLVDIPDTALRRAVERALDKEAGDPITRDEMATLRSLSVTACAALTGIEHAVNLKTFASGYGRVSTLEPLAGLTSLTSLTIHQRDRISGLRPLENLTLLEQLTVSGAEVVDLRPLSDLTTLNFIELDRNAIVDLSPLAGLTSLRHLELSENKVTDLGPLSALASLRWLELRHNEVVDLSPLAGLTSLYNVVLNGNKIVDLSPLADFTWFDTLFLDLQDNAIEDLSPLVANERLESGDWVLLNGNPLSVRSNETHTLTLVRRHVNVRSDYLATPVDIPDMALRMAIEDAAYKDPGEEITLGDMWGLFDFVRGSGVRRLDGVEDAINLRGLELLDGSILDLSPLDGLTLLESLDLSSNRIADLSSLAELTELVSLNLSNNRISDVSPLVQNAGMNSGDDLFLGRNPLGVRAYRKDVPTLLKRGVRVHYTGAREIPDDRLRELVLRVSDGGLNLDELEVLDAVGLGIGDLTGLEAATALMLLFLDRNSITDIKPLANLFENLGALSLAHNRVGDLMPLAAMDSLYWLALDGNALREVPRLPCCLSYLYLANNAITSLGDLRSHNLVELDISGNALSSLAGLRHLRALRYLHVHDNEIVDISPLNVESIRELRMANNAVRDISPLLDGEELLMVDVRRNPLADSAVAVLQALRERGVTVLAGETVPYFPAAGDGRQGFVRVINRSDEGGHAFIEAVDDAGVRVAPVRVELGARRTVHFNSEDLENGNGKKGIDGIGAPTAGDWRLSIMSALDLEVLSYIRTGDGFVTAMHDVAADALVPFFNPGSNRNQRSTLRVVNTEAEPAKWMTGGYDDAGHWRPMTGSMLVRPQHALTLTAEALEDAHGMGDGHGKWRLRVRGFPWYAMSLLESPTGHLTNLSTAPNNATPLGVEEGVYRHRLPLVPSAGGDREGFVRVINTSPWERELTIEAVDDEGNRFGPVELAVAAGQTVHFNSSDLETGNAAKGLFSGIGAGSGDWRLELTSQAVVSWATLDLQVLAYIRTSDGFLTSMHDLAPRTEDGDLWIPFFNPGGNRNQVSHLRLVNWGDAPAGATITAIDDDGQTPGDAVRVTIPALAARTFTAAELETGDADGLSDALGDGKGKWRLRVAADEEVDAMSLLSLPTGHMTNLSTTPRHPPRARSER